MTIREATHEDFEEIWPIFYEIVSAGETYAYPRDTKLIHHPGVLTSQATFTWFVQAL